MRKLDLRGKTAVVCGASAGLGQALATELASRKLEKLVLIARDGERLASVASVLESYPDAPQIIQLSADLCTKSELCEVAQTLRAECSRIHLLVQAVGQSDRGTLSELDTERLHRLVDTNVTSSLNALCCFRDLLAVNDQDSKPSTCVLIGSLASLFAPRFLGGYAIAKHALAAVAQQARLEYAKDGIHVLLACPGPIARADAGTRYQTTDADLPSQALQPGGGAKLKGLKADKLAGEIIDAACQRKRRLIRPRSAALLLLISAVSPALADFILRKKTS